MLYSTLKEVYNVDSFERKKKKKKEEYQDDEYENDTDLVPKKPSVVSQLSQTSPPNSPILKSIQHDNKDNKLSSSINDIHPYYDKDLEQYLYEPVASKENTKSLPLQFSKLNNRENFEYSPRMMYDDSIQDAKNIYYKNLVNIGLFIFIGILIIFLCDQITEIAINLGMKKTVKILQPYIKT